MELNDLFGPAGKRVVVTGAGSGMGHSAARLLGSVLEDMYLSTWNGHWATPEEMGWPMVALRSRLCSHVSGQVLYIDWGSQAEWELDTVLS